MIIHIIQQEETLTTIAAQYKVDVQDIRKNNPRINDVDMIVPGMKLMIPQESKQIKQEVHKETKKRKKRVPEQRLHAMDHTVETKRPIGYVQHDDTSKKPVQPLQSENPSATKIFPKHAIQQATRPMSKNNHDDKPKLYCDCCHRPINIKQP